MEYYGIYHQEQRPHLEHVTDIQATSASHALAQFVDRFGDNYGKVVVLPSLGYSAHHVFSKEG